MSIKSGRGRLSSTNSLTEKTLRNWPCEYAAWPPSCQSPTCQRPAAIRPVPDLESIEWYSAISEIWSQSRSRLHFAVENIEHLISPATPQHLRRNVRKQPRLCDELHSASKSQPV